MHVQSAPPAVSASLRRFPGAPPGRALTKRLSIAVESIGYLVPRTDFVGRIHSVFAHACNIACHDTLLTMCASGAGEGPTTLRLAHGAPDVCASCLRSASGSTVATLACAPAASSCG